MDENQVIDEKNLLAEWRPKSPADFTEASLQFKALKLAQSFDGRLPMADELRNVTEELGIEIATNLLVESIKLSRTHGEWLARLRQLTPKDLNLIRADAGSYEVTIVASNLSQSGREWADHVEPWRQWARELGFTTDTIETDRHLSIAENARTIQYHLMALRRPKRILITYGQGAAEVRFWLQKSQHKIIGTSELPPELADVHAWINVCGAYNGAKSSQWMKSSRPRRFFNELDLRFRGRSKKALIETSSDFPMWNERTILPKHWLVMNIFGLAYQNQMQTGLHSSFFELSKSMPNDGVVQSADAMAPGYAIPIMGMNHRASEAKLKPVMRRALALTCLHLTAREDVIRGLNKRQPQRRFDLDFSEV
jgi:hypothetical protein